MQRARARTIANPLTYLWQGFGNRPDEGWAPTSSQILATVALAGLILTGVLPGGGNGRQRCFVCSPSSFHWRRGSPPCSASCRR
ncbi:hypothetical protein N8D56_07505 [Devosia sp. A8/3-2]|nr:hypothetical protein N8D56_07505 [Devosia sp. A8/3-2]